ncbi:MAG TPA: DUF362 domain-containing protein [Bryobacteraceae bacterium]|jgi:uncharacterized protein (DUF362 family)|nr:DUF362 domain-containing protein [Bryobacteraceae bacterium]
MKNRREFLRNSATGALLLGSQGAFGLSNILAIPAEHLPGRVVISRDPGLYGQSGQPDEKRVLDLLDRAMAAYTGRQNTVAAWKQVIARGNARDKVIGLKTNGLGGKGISTHAVLVLAIAERLQQAGVKPCNILVWDRNARDLEACGLAINTDPSRIRCYGSDVAGFEDQVETWGSSHARFSKILTRECAIVINLPILKDHSMAGVTFAMKNMYGVVERPQDLHADGCNPGVADLNAMPAVREKIKLTIGDAMSSVYEGGPGFHPEHLWYPNALLVGDDRVALDQTAWEMLEKKRAEAGLPTFEAAGRPPRYIATAADAAHGLGVNDLKRINRVEV